MNRLTLLATSCAFLAGTVPLPAQTASYTIDPAHSEVDFSIRHMAISTVHGRFSLKNGTVILDPKDITKSSVEAVIDVPSVDTGTAQRDTHLKSPDFFDAAKYPIATFHSERITRDGTGYNVVGNLTLHGVTKSVTLQMEEPSKDQIGMDGKPHRGFTATTTIHRQDFGLTWSGTVKSGDNVLGDDVKMTFEIEASQK